MEHVTDSRSRTVEAVAQPSIIPFALLCLLLYLVGRDVLLRAARSKTSRLID